jgi:hypothetical protein
MSQRDPQLRPAKGRGQPRTTDLVGDLLSLRRQIAVVAASPAIVTAHQLTAEVSAVLEPVWSVLATRDDTTGIGFLRRLGGTTTEVQALNDAVAHRAVQTYQKLDLAAPAMRDVWRCLAKPAAALVASVRSSPGRQAATPGSEPTACTLGATVRPVLPVVLFDTWTDDTLVVPALRRVLRRWCDLARNATGEQCEVARLTLAAALLARGAILDGDTATVKWFVSRWLGLRSTDTRVDGASAALLEDGWVSRSVDEDFSAVRDTVTDLRIEAAYQHRLHRPAWETQLRGMPIGLLSEQTSSSHTTGVALTDTLAATDNPFAVIDHGFLELQLKAVLATVSVRECFVIWDRFHDVTQAQVAAKLGISVRKVREIERHTMRKLRHPSRSQVLRDYLEV